MSIGERMLPFFNLFSLPDIGDFMKRLLLLGAFVFTSSTHAIVIADDGSIIGSPRVPLGDSEERALTDEQLRAARVNKLELDVIKLENRIKKLEQLLQVELEEAKEEE